MRTIKKGRTAARPNSRAPGLSTYPRARVLGYLPRGRRRSSIGLWTSGQVNAAQAAGISASDVACVDRGVSTPDRNFPVRTAVADDPVGLTEREVVARCKGAVRTAHANQTSWRE